MHATGLKEFDHTIHTTNIWLKDLMDELGWDDRHRTYHALRVVLHTLRDLLPPNVVLHLGSQLPMLMRGFYLEGWKIPESRIHERSEHEFVAHIADAFPFDFAVDPRSVAVAVFNMLSRHVSAGQITKIKATLPAGVRKLWQ